MRTSLLLGAAALLGAAGCGDGLSTDPSVFVDATVQSPTINVEKKSAIAFDLSGGFTLVLHLGPRASGTAEVSVNDFSLISEDQNTVIVDTLKLTASGQELPIKVDPGTDEEVAIQIDANLNDQATASKVCSFGVLRYKGSITDSLRGGIQPVVTGPVNVSGTGCATP